MSNYLQKLYNNFQKAQKTTILTLYMYKEGSILTWIFNSWEQLSTFQTEHV